MCGLVGVIGTIDRVDNMIFRDLLRVDVLRGPHSTGICSRERMHEPVVFKKALLPDDLFALKQAAGLFSDMGHNDILMGHNRWATMGKVNHANAHPFEMTNIIGAHNGTLRKQHLLPDHTGFTVDSENIFHSFEKLGVRETVKLLDGAFALTWFDKNTNVFNFARNDERTLYFCFSEKARTFYYASEDWMLEGVLARHKVAHQGILPFEPLYHYQLQIPSQGAVFGKRSFTMTPLEEYEPPKYSPPASTNRWNQYQQENASNGNSNGNSGKGTSATVTDLTTRMNRTNGTETSDVRPYEEGDDIFFKLMQDPPGEKYLVGRDVSNVDRRVYLYVPRGAVLRKKLLGSDIDDWWAGVVNSYNADGIITVQANSIQSYDEYAETQGWDDDTQDAEEVAITQDDPAWERHVELIASVGRCAWCDEHLDPTDDNHIENAHTIICPSCKKLDEVKDFISIQQEIPF